MLFYLRIFNFLWRAKRIEYSLTEIWKNQMTCNKILRAIPGELVALFCSIIIACDYLCGQIDLKILRMFEMMIQ